jgi:hypothetical protein
MADDSRILWKIPAWFGKRHESQIKKLNEEDGDINRDQQNSNLEWL